MHAYSHAKSKSYHDNSSLLACFPINAPQSQSFQVKQKQGQHIACNQNLESVNACPLPHLFSFFNSSYFFEIPDYIHSHHSHHSALTNYTFMILMHFSFLYLSAACSTPSPSLYHPTFIIIIIIGSNSNLLYSTGKSPCHATKNYLHKAVTNLSVSTNNFLSATSDDLTTPILCKHWQHTTDNFHWSQVGDFCTESTIEVCLNILPHVVQQPHHHYPAYQNWHLLTPNNNLSIHLTPICRNTPAGLPRISPIMPTHAENNSSDLIFQECMIWMFKALNQGSIYAISASM